MKFKSASIANLARALLISLLAHLLLLWQSSSSTPPGSRASQSSGQANVMNAWLRDRSASDTQNSSRIPDNSHAVHTQTSGPTARQGATARPIAQPLERSPAQVPAPLADSSHAAAPAIQASLADDALDRNGLLQYRLSVAAATRRFKSFPPAAVENGWSGTAEVGVAIAASGAPQPVRLLRSSGYALLDAAALEMIAQAVPQAAVPASLQGRGFSLALPVVFDSHGE